MATTTMRNKKPGKKKPNGRRRPRAEGGPANMMFRREPFDPFAFMHRKPAVETVKERLDTKLIKNKDVVIIGCGGIGSWLIRAITIYLRSLGVTFGFTLVDGDEYGPENMYRCDVPGIGNKAEVWLGEMLERGAFKDSDLAPAAFTDYVTEENIGRVIRNGSVVFLCVDNHKTRKLVNQHCLKLKNVVLISGGNDGIGEGTDGTYGNVMVLVRQKGQTVAGRSLEQFHPEIRSPADKRPDEMNCLELAMAGEPQLTFTNMAVASAMLNVLLRLMMKRQAKDRLYDEVALSVYDNKMTPVRYGGA